MRISETVSQVTPSITLAISAKAKAMRAQGVDVIALSAGEPDFQTPDHICEAGIQAIRDGFTRYTPAGGTLELKKSVANWFRATHDLAYDPVSQIIVNCGAKHSVFLAIFALVGRGEEAIIPAPYWVSYPEMVKLAGGTPVFVDGDERHGLRITADQLDAAITDKTRLLIMNSPSNPTGMVYTRTELKALAEVIIDRDIMVLSDEIYQKLIYDGVSHVPLAGLSAEMFKRTITVYGVSKTYAMTGWRIGFTAGPAEVIKAMGTIQSQETSNPSSISQKAALEALTGPQNFLDGWVEEFASRRDYVVERLNAMEGVTCLKPSGSFYVFPDVSHAYGRSCGNRTVTDSVSLCEYLLHEHHIALVPGAGFGNDRHVRISYAVSMQELEKALDRMEEGLARLT